MDCYLCQDAGRKLAADRTLDNGKGVCRFHGEGLLMATAAPAVEVGADSLGMGPPNKETSMPKKIEIDLTKLKQLHAQGLNDREIAEKLGGSGATVRVRRIELGLAAGRRGRGIQGNARHQTETTRASIASAGGDFKPRRKAGASPVASRGRVTLSVDETFLDSLWAGLDMAQKAQLVNGLCGG